MFPSRRTYVKKQQFNDFSSAFSILRGRSLQIYEEITNTMYNERRLELLKGGSSLEGVLLPGRRSKSAIKQRGQSWEPIASIGANLLSVASHHQVRGRVELVR